ncbi:MAG: thiamine pyrophosphate-binding protein [Myxococcales bacterium]|nr:thiamine pyrophosphate-binding protein [Myxococcales bacterium]
MRAEELPKGHYPGGTIVAAALESAGVTHTFGIPGTHNIELYDAMARQNRVEPVLITDEQSAGFICDGMARSGGPLGCANVVPGAGVTHVLSGIGEAFMDGVPVLLLTCGIRTDSPYKYQLHDVDQLAIVRPLCKGTWKPTQAHEIVPAILEAAWLAQSGCPGPTAVEIPANLYLFAHDYDPAPARALVDEIGRRPVAAADFEMVQTVAEMLCGAARPLIHVGLGAADAADRLPELAELLGAVVSSTFSGKGVFAETHPLWLWPGFGTACPSQLRKIAAECDAALLLGARMGEVSTASYGVTVPEASAQVDIDAGVPGANFPVRHKVVADARGFVEALLATLHRMQRARPDVRDLTRRLADAHLAVRQEQATPPVDGRVSPDALFRATQRIFPPGTRYTTDSGNGTFLAVEHLRLDRPRHLLSPTDYSCMGYALPAAIGAAFAHPGDPVVVFAGDGALLMTGLELITAATNRLAVAVLVLRDGELGQIASFQRTLTNAAPCSVLPDYDLGALAAVAGVECRGVDSDADLDEVLQWALSKVQAGQPAVVDVRIDYGRKTYFTKGVVVANFPRLPWLERLRMVRRAIARRIVR